MEQAVWMWDVMHIFCILSTGDPLAGDYDRGIQRYPAAAADRPPGTVPNAARRDFNRQRKNMQHACGYQRCANMNKGAECRLVQRKPQDADQQRSSFVLRRNYLTAA